MAVHRARFGAGERTGVGVTTVVTGVEATITAIKAFDKNLYRSMDAQLRRATAVVAREAAASAPARTGAMRAGYRVMKNRRFRYTISYRVINQTPEGAILEFAGSTTDGSTPQGRSLIDSLTATYGTPGRFAWEAFDQRRDVIRDRVVGIIATAEARMQSELDRIG